MSDTKPNTTAAEPEYLLSSERSKFPFYKPNIDSKLVPETQELLEKYSHVPREEQSAHVHKMREEAFDIRGYPCTGLGVFLVPQLRRLEVYPEVLRRVQDGGILMDVGCFIGHDLRRLVYDGAPSDRLYGIDIANHWEVGYGMFRDRDKFHAHFIEAYIHSTTNAELLALKGEVDVISVQQVLHLWDLDGQVQASLALSTFTKPGSLIVGNQLGHPEAQQIFNDQMKIKVYWHNPESFARMFDQVGAASGTKWETRSRLVNFEDVGWDRGDTAWLPVGVQVIEFAARRIQ